MKIDSIELREIAIPLKFNFAQSNNKGAAVSSSLIMEVLTEDGAKGYGESCPRSYVTGETTVDVCNDLVYLKKRLSEKPIESFEELNDHLLRWKVEGVGPSTLCAFEMAWIDAWSKQQNQSLDKILDTTLPEAIHYSLVIPLMSSKGLSELLDQIKIFSPSSIKLKADADLDKTLENIRLIRETFGTEIPIRFDVNGGWTYEEAKRQIPEFLKASIRSFEQPLAAKDWTGLRKLTQEFGKDAIIMADETLLNRSIAEKLIHHQIVNHFNLKIAKLGGILKTAQIYQLARENGIPCQLGAHFGETTLLTKAGILTSALCTDLSANEGALGDHLLEMDINKAPVKHDLDGQLLAHALFDQPGMVHDIEEETVKKVTVLNWTF